MRRYQTLGDGRKLMDCEAADEFAGTVTLLAARRSWEASLHLGHQEFIKYSRRRPLAGALADRGDIIAGQANALRECPELGGILGIVLIWRGRLREIVTEGSDGGPVVSHGEDGLGPIRLHTRLRVQPLEVAVGELHEHAVHFPGRLGNEGRVHQRA
jgi:hypothetical protein